MDAPWDTPTVCLENKFIYTLNLECATGYARHFLKYLFIQLRQLRGLRPRFIFNIGLCNYFVVESFLSSYANSE